MHSLVQRSILCTSLLFPCLANAQGTIAEVQTLALPNSHIDMDKVGAAGATTLAAINAGGSNGGATIANISLFPVTVARGIYNTNPGNGRALGLDNGGMALIDPPAGQFDAFRAQIDLAGPSSEFGVSVGDWAGTGTISFYSKGSLITAVTTTRFGAGALIKRFQASGGITFDRVDVDVGGNWVIPDLIIEQVGGYVTYGQGCKGTAGVPSLDAAANNKPTLGQMFTLEVKNMPAIGGAFVMGFGFSNQNFPGLGALPFDLTPVGMPGCQLLTTLAATANAGNIAGTGTFSLPIPNNPNLKNVVFYNQAFVIDPGANALSLTTSNGGRGSIQ